MIFCDPRTEGYSQAFGVLRPTMELAATVQSQTRAVSSVPFSNQWTFDHSHMMQALTNSAKTLDQFFRLHRCWLPREIFDNSIFRFTYFINDINV